MDLTRVSLRTSRNGTTVNGVARADPDAGARSGVLPFTEPPPRFDSCFRLAECELFMSTDPYHAVQSEIAGSLQAAEQLRASYVRIRSTARGGSEELEWARNEVRESPPM